ncbi:MAG: hypothetical protein ACK5LX_13260 [Oscillospiraceae bacterium]
MSSFQKDRGILRLLTAEYAEIANLPVQEEKRRLWRALNGLRPERPMVMIDQICWNELESDEPLQLHCETEECRGYEAMLRRKLYQWKHFPVDMVAEPYILVPKAVVNSGFGLIVEEETRASDPSGGVLSHRYVDILQTEEDIEKITIPKVWHDTVETNRRMELAGEIFDGILPVYAEGVEAPVQIWDPISMYKGVEDALYALVDEPEFIHKLVARMAWSYSGMLDQLEEQGLLATHQTLVHCTGAYSDELPAQGYNPQLPRAKDMWSHGEAQMFSNVSGAMHQEFELEYVSPLYQRFGLVYYGCCDPLDKKMEYIGKIPHLRKVSMSPWVDVRCGAEAIAGKFVYSCKPNPAYLAAGSFDGAVVRGELEAVKAACEEASCPLEFILKDISTVKHDANRLDAWAKIAMEIAGA